MKLAQMVKEVATSLAISAGRPAPSLERAARRRRARGDLCSDDAVVFDPHYQIGSVPGDGIHSCFQELLGVKRAAYALLTSEAIDAKKALEYGMVNEVLPREKLLERAYVLADHIMTQPRTTRRLTTQIVRRPWRKQITDSLDGGFGIQMFAHLAKARSIHGNEHVGSSIAYVRKGQRNGFDGE